MSDYVQGTLVREFDRTFLTVKITLALGLKRFDRCPGLGPALALNQFLDEISFNLFPYRVSRNSKPFLLGILSIERINASLWLCPVNSTLPFNSRASLIALVALISGDNTLVEGRVAACCGKTRGSEEHGVSGDSLMFEVSVEMDHFGRWW